MSSGSALLSPVFEGDRDMIIGPSIRCRDCGAHLPWSRTQRHICPSRPRVKPFRFDPSKSVTINSGNVDTSMRQPVWQKRNKKPSNLSQLDWNKVHSYQRNEIRGLKDISNSGSEFYFDDDRLSTTASSHSTDSSSLLAAIGDDQKKEQWSWAEREASRNRKYSMPVERSQLDADIIKSLHNRSNSVPEEQIHAAARVAQFRRRKSRDVAEQKRFFDNLLQDIDVLMEKVDQTIDTARIAKERQAPPASERVESPPPVAETAVEQERPTFVQRSKSLPRKMNPTGPGSRRNGTVAGGFVSGVAAMTISSANPVRRRAETPADAVSRPLQRTKSMKKRLDGIDIENVSEAQQPSLMNRPTSPIAARELKRDLQRNKGDESVLECGGCDNDIHMNRDRYIEAAGRSYHLDCFKCEVCRRVLSYKEPFWQDVGRVRKDGSYEEGLIMCQRDYEWLLNTKIKRV